MVKDTLEFDTVKQCNRYMHTPTEHPLVSVVDLEKESMSRYAYLKCNFYVVLLLEHSCCDFYYGRRTYDYSDGNMVFLTPQECLDLDIAECDNCFKRGKMLIFHKDLFLGTPLEKHFYDDYTYFRYRDNESLHISKKEYTLASDCLQLIAGEVAHDIDRFSARLITRNIELLLDYCMRFYERQFITRHDENIEKLHLLNRIIEEYVESGKMKTQGALLSEGISEALSTSPAYFIDMLKYEKGMMLREYIEIKSMEIAKKWIIENRNINEIATLLGLKTPAFISLFRKMIGLLPDEYKESV